MSPAGKKSATSDNTSAEIAFRGEVYPWQSSQWQRMTDAMKEGRLPHAILLQGTSGLGKTAFAIQMAKSLLCHEQKNLSSGSDVFQLPCNQCSSCELMNAGTHPDFYYIEPTASKNATSKKPLLSIRIDEIRDLCSSLAHTSQFGGYRVAVLTDVDKMTRESANSLLKTLEEPGQNVVIILTTSRASRIPATIRSRCQHLRFSSPDESQAIQWLANNVSGQFNEQQQKSALQQSGGAPLSAANFLQQEELIQLLQKALSSRADNSNVLEFASKLMAFDRGMVLGMMMQYVSDAIKYRVMTQSHQLTYPWLANLVTAISIPRLYWYYEQLQDQRRKESIAVNEQLLWENLLLSWKQL